MTRLSLLCFVATAGAVSVLVSLAPHVLRRPPVPVERALAVVSAVLAAVLATSSLTGYVLIDAAGRGALGAGGVLLGARASTTAASLTAALSAVFAVGSPAQPLASANAAMMLAPMFAVRRAELLTAVAGGVAAQVALHLTRPDVRGGTAVAALVLLAPIVASGVSRLPGGVRRRVLRGLLVGGAVCGAAAVLGLVSALQARPSLQEGLAAAKTGVRAAQLVHQEDASAHLAVAHEAFADADAALTSIWARPAWIVPGVAQHMRVLRDVALSGEQLAVAGAAFVAADFESIRPRDGEIPLDRVVALERSLAPATERVGRAYRRISRSNSPWLVPPLKNRLERELERLAEVSETSQQTQRLLRLLPGMLGANGPRRYFLAIQTPAELRATGGFMGNHGEITAEGGRLRLSAFGRASNDLNKAGDGERELLAPPSYVARYGRFAPDLFWQNVNVSPDFPTVAQVVANLYPQSGGDRIDGVIGVDPSGFAALLRLTGPVAVPGWPEPLTADNVEQVLLYDQYVRFTPQDVERHDFLGSAAREVWQRVTQGSIAGPGELVNALGPAARQKHFFVASMRPEEQQLFEDAGLAGRMAPVAGDFLGIVTQNAAANKIDWFLRREVRYDVAVNPSTGELQAHVNLVLRNGAPDSGLPDHVIGGEARPLIPLGSNKMFLSIYTPWSLEEARVDGVTTPFESADELGRRVYSRFVVVPPNGSLAVDLFLSGSLPPSNRYRLDVHRQTAVAPDGLIVNLALAAGWETDGGTEAWRTDLQLDRDRTIEVDLRRPAFGDG